MCLAFLLCTFAKGFAADTAPLNEEIFKQISRNDEITEAVKLLEKTPAKPSYRIILGENPTKKPVKIKFKNLSLLSPAYADYNALGWKMRSNLYIYINNKHKNNVPKEALSTIIASIALHDDEQTSINEQIYAYALEGFLWNYFTTKDPKLKNRSSTLKSRHDTLEELFLKSPSDLKYVTKYIEIDPAHADLPRESEGYTNKELEIKKAKMYSVYCAYSGVCPVD